jgi:hypothetical protein
VRLGRLVFLTLLLFLFAWPARSDVPTRITFQGHLTDLGGVPLTGTHSLAFRLYNVPTGGVQLWTETQSTSLENGFYDVFLGDLTPLPATAFSGVTLWLQVAVDGTDLPSRLALVTVPYAFRAQVADTARALTGDASIRTIARAHGYGSEDTDIGPLPTRILYFVKTQASTGIRVSYVDNHRAIQPGGGGNAGCRWEIRFNGASCAIPGVLAYDYYAGGLTNLNLHRSDASFGTCFGLPAGVYQIRVYVGASPGYGSIDCYTGWSNQYWSLEAEEVF